MSTSAPTTLTSTARFPPPPPVPLPTLPSPSTATSDNEGSTRIRSRTGSLDLSSNPLYGLHALNNLDIAVNGKEVNSMPSYREIRRRGLDGSGGSDDNSSTALDRYDVGSSSSNFLPPPPKPPRKAPSTSPPSLRRNDAIMTHYARPATVSSPTSQLDQMMMNRDERFRKRFADSNNDDSAIASGGDGGGTDDASGSNPSYRFNGGPPQVRHRSSPPRLASPSRTCLTDSEILRSPTEVLYAVSDKRKIRDNSDVKSVSASVQTMRSELRQNPPGYYAKNPNRPSRNSSREDLLTDDASYVSTGRRSTSLQHPSQQQQQQQQRRTPSYNGSKFGHHSARSLERFLDGDDKENAFKTRIQVNFLKAF